MHPLDNMRLTATYGFVSDGDTIAFGADGRFQERGMLRWIARTSLTGTSGPTSGAGSYTVTRGTLELRYEDGTMAYLFVATPPGDPPSQAPESLYLRRTRLERLR